VAFANTTAEELIADVLESGSSERELDLAMRLANALEEVEQLAKENADLKLQLGWQGA
jgi:hypothetical protein